MGIHPCPDAGLLSEGAAEHTVRTALALLVDVGQRVQHDASLHPELGRCHEMAIDGEADLRMGTLVLHLPVQI